MITLSSSHVSSKAALLPARSGAHPAGTAAARATWRDTVTLSPLARSLQRDIESAQARLNNASPDELKAMAKRTLRDVSFQSRDAPLASENLASSVDPARVEFSRRVTQFLDRFDPTGDPVALDRANPLFGMVRGELVAILHDETGSFTKDERLAAQSEIGRQDGEWSRKVVAHVRAELAATGSTHETDRDLLTHYENLPDIEKTDTVNDYIMLLRRRTQGAADDGRRAELKELTMALLRLLASTDKPDALLRKLLS